MAAVNERLTKEITFWQDRWVKLSDDKATGKDVALPLGNVVRTLDELQGRLDGRKKELQLMRHVTSATPIALGGALVISNGLTRKLRDDTPEDPVAAAFAVDAAARARIERIAMDAVRRSEERRGCTVVDVSAG